jgi:hypothetical protein
LGGGVGDGDGEGDGVGVGVGDATVMGTFCADEDKAKGKRQQTRRIVSSEQ